MDKDLREAERSGDAVRLLRERLRAGELTQAHVELAASLGHEATREVCPDVELRDWSLPEWKHGTAAEASRLLSKQLLVRVAADWAERVLPVWEDEYPDEPAPSKAIAAARAWADCPCSKHQYRAKFAAEDVEEEAVSAGQDTRASHAAWAAYSAAMVAEATPSGPGANPDTWLSGSGSHALEAAENPEAECEWQRLRLAAYVLGEVETDEPAA